MVPILKQEGIDVIISSPFMRTVQTATPIAETLGIEILKDERLQEWDVGSFSGASYLAPDIIADTKRAYSEPTHRRG
ncbi:histidine phosphatase family protein [Candidatus Peribacteria bacterium]|nr:histidine phosphatase family protein [Candidatus Peribacteria bacterium]